MTTNPKFRGKDRSTGILPVHRRAPQFVLSVLSVLFCTQVWAYTASPAPRPHGRRFDAVKLTKNQWAMPITNYGSFGHDVARGIAGGEWPRGSGNMYIFGAGIWFGRTKKSPTGTDTNVSVGYNPNSGKAEFTPGASDKAGSGYAGRDYERVYMYPEDWPPDPLAFPEYMRDSTRTTLRIPPSGAGDTIFGWFHAIPRAATSTGDCWSVFNDLDVTLMEQPAKTKSCSIEVYQYTYDWALPWNRDVVFFACNVHNIGHDTIKNAYMGMCCDADIGGANNDYAGLLLHKYIHSPSGTDSIYVDNVGMAWSDRETGWPTFPGVVGFDFLQSPFKKNAQGRIRNYPDTTLWFPDGLDNNDNGLIDEPAEGEQIGMTSYKIFTLQAGDPPNDNCQYLALQGKEWWVNPPNYQPYDSLDNTPNDKRFLQSSGPFSLPPDSMVTLTIAAIGAPMTHLPGDRDTSFYALAVNDRAAQQAYDNNWISPVPPPSPNFTLLPGDGKITILWDDSPERAADPFFPFSRALKSPYYRQFDLEGYKVYRSRTGRVGEWALLTQCDKLNGIKFEDAQPESIRTRATDSGLFYAYVDSVGLRYGFPYYYAVTSFDYNTLGVVDTARALDTTHLVSESGMLPMAATTRTQPGNYRPASAGVQQIGGNCSLKVVVEPLVIAPHAIGYDTFQLRFSEPTYKTGNIPVYSYKVFDSRGDSTGPRQTFSIDFLHDSPDTLRLTATVFSRVPTKVYYDTLKQLSYEKLYWKVRNRAELKASGKDGTGVEFQRSAHWQDNANNCVAMPPSGAWIVEYPANQTFFRRHEAVRDRFTDVATAISTTSYGVGCDDQYVYKPGDQFIYKFRLSDGTLVKQTYVGLTAPDYMFGVANDTVWLGDGANLFYGFPTSALAADSARPAATWDVGTTDSPWRNVAWDGSCYYVTSGDRSPSTLRRFERDRTTYTDFNIPFNAQSVLAWSNYQSNAWLPTVSLQIAVKMDTLLSRVLDSIHVIGGHYPSARFGFTPTINASYYYYLWAYRGSDYRIVWTLNERGKLKPEVYDLENEALVNFKAAPVPSGSESLAAGWCLYDSIRPTLLRAPTDTLTPGRTRSLAINGALFDLNRGKTVSVDTAPAPGDTWIVYALKHTPAPVLATYRIATEPMEYLTERQTLNVKAVPNPYIIRNAWEGHHDFRRMKFINLPDHCTIRLYNLSGDLIRTLAHVATNPRVGNIVNQQGGDEDWDLLSESGQRIAPGIYLFHIESDVGSQIGKFAIVY
jgi:hypothetical protein